MCTRGAQHAHTSSSESRHSLQAGSLLLGLSPPVEQKARRAAASTRHRREPRAPGRSTDAVSFPGVPSHACISGRMLFLSACLCWLVHTAGGEGIDRVQGGQGALPVPSLTMGWGWWLSHPLPTVITSCLAFPTSSDTGGHTPLLESTAQTPRVLLGRPFCLPPPGALLLRRSRYQLWGLCGPWATTRSTWYRRLFEGRAPIRFGMLAVMWGRLWDRV